MKNIRASAAELLLDKKYDEAIRAYTAALISTPELADHLDFNLALARRRWRLERIGQPPAVAVCGWELSHNAAGRVRALADIWREVAPTEIIGATFAHWSDSLWAPIRNIDLPCHAIHIADDRQFIHQALELVLAHPYDVVHLSKPRMPNIVFGLLYKLIWSAQVILDIDDEELGAFKEDTLLSLEDLVKKQGGVFKWDKLPLADWTRVAVGFADRFDAVTVSNPALQSKYGGTVLPHARPAEWFKNDRRAQSRADHGIEPDKTVVLFFGTPRKHKGLFETARAIAALGRHDLCYLIVGDFPDPKIKAELEAIDGLDLRFLPGQPYEAIPEIAAIGDICVLLQSDSSLTARYQVPAKLTDALAAGLLVLAQPTPGMMEFVERGVVVPTSAELLTKTLARWLDDKDEADRIRAAGKNFFRTHLSVEVCRPVLAGLANNTRPRPNPRLLLENPAQKDLFDVLGGWQMFREPDSVPETPIAEVAAAPDNSPDPAVLQAQDARIVVYSVLIGDYEAVKEPEVLDPSVRYVLFTDNATLQSDGWEVVPVDTLGLSPRRASRLPKLLPHRYLPEHDISVYMDASLTIVEADIRSLVADALQQEDIAAYPHFERACVYDEIDECIAKGKVDAIAAQSLADRLRAEGFPAKRGLLENAFLIRRNTAQMRALNDAWHEEFRDGPGRDQFHLMYLLWKRNISWRALENAVQFRKSPHLRFKAHTGAADPAFHLPGNKTRINWVIGGPSSKGWAYENNARRLIEKMPEFEHVINDEDYADCAIYFDTIIHKKYKKQSGREILRLGGPNPVRREYGTNPEAIAEGLSNFDAIVALSRELKCLAEMSSATVKMAPNGVDLTRYRPAIGRSLKAEAEFTVGFAGNCKNEMERAFKGLDILEDAVSHTGVKLLALQKGKNQIPHERMVEDFYHKIDCLVHPVGPGKEGCSNVVMEALACGVPVITTRDCGFHGDMLIDGVNVLFCERTAESIAEKINTLRSDLALCYRLSASGAKFARVHHDLNVVANSFRKVIFETLGVELNEHRARPRLRIAMFTTSFWPKFAGMEMMVHNLATALQRMGNDIVLFTRTVKEKFTEIEHEYDLVRTSLESAAMHAAFEAKHSEAPFDAIYVQGAYRAATLVHELNATYGLPLILRTHGEDIQIEKEIGYGFRLDPAVDTIIRNNMRRANVNVSISRHVLKDARPLAVECDNRVISNGVDCAHFTRSRNRFLHERFSLPSETRILLMVGRNVRKKAFHLAIEALAHLKREFKDVVLVHVGKEGNGENLRQAAEERGVSDQFLEYGEANYFDMPKVYAAADVLVFPSRMETFGNVTVEAMAAGLPCVEFDYGANRDKIIHGRTGFILPFGDTLAMAKAIKTLLCDPKKLKKFSDESLRFVRQRFDWTVIAKQYHQAFLDHSLLASPRPRRLRIAFAADKMLRIKGGGGEKSLTGLVNAMASRGHETYLVIKEANVASYEKAFYPLPKNVRICNILGWTNSESVPKGKSREDLFKRTIELIQPDVLVGFFLPEFGFIARGVEGLDVPLLLSHRNDPKEKLQNTAERYPRRLPHIDFANERAQKFSIQLQPYIDLLPEIAKPKAVVIPNSVPLIPDSLCATPDAPAERNIILNVARLASAKHQDLMIRAFSRIAAEHPEWDIHIYGDGPLQAEIEALIDKQGMTGRVILKGTTQDIMPAYRNSKIFAFPSLYEGFSRALSEAMMHGLPSVVIDRCICSNEFIGQSGGGIVTSDDEIAFAAALDHLIRHPAERRTLGAKARAYVKRFAPHEVDELWERVLFDVASQRVPPLSA